MKKFIAGMAVGALIVKLLTGILILVLLNCPYCKKWLKEHCCKKPEHRFL